MADSSMSKVKLGPQESEENGKCDYMVWVGGHRSNAVVTQLISFFFPVYLFIYTVT